MDALFDQSALTSLAERLVKASGTDKDAAIMAARERLAEVLPNYKRPRRFEVVVDLPRTATGKVQRHKLRSQARLDSH